MVNIDQTEYGRDLMGINKLTAKITNEYQQILKRFDQNTNPLYKEFTQVVDKNWSGTDADNFKKEVWNDYLSYKSLAKRYYDALINSFNQSYSDFAKFQDKNI